MTPEQQRIKIAEACGWTWKQGAHADFLWHDSSNIAHSSVCKERSPLGCIADLPDYLNDLNAMHEAEKVLLGMCDNDPQADLWISYLANLVLAAPCCLREHATAAQRAEAFLKTLDLWEESK